MIEFSRGNYEQKSRQILEATRGLSSTDLEGTHLIECLRSQLSAVTEEIKRLRNERDEARREVCRDEAYRPSPSPPCTANQVANRRGWDCFKDNTNE
jgi:hypothetical protein